MQQLLALLRNYLTHRFSARLPLTKNPEGEFGEDEIEEGYHRDDEGYEDQHNGGVSSELLARRPDDLAKLSNDLAVEACCAFENISALLLYLTLTMVDIAHRALLTLLPIYTSISVVNY